MALGLEVIDYGPPFRLNLIPSTLRHSFSYFHTSFPLSLSLSFVNLHKMLHIYYVEHTQMNRILMYKTKLIKLHSQISDVHLHDIIQTDISKV